MSSKEDIYRENDRDSESVHEGEYDGLVSGTPRRPIVDRKFSKASKLVSGFLIISVLLNVAQLFLFVVCKPKFYSQYAHLPENELEIPFHYATEYSDDQHTHEEKDALWNAIDISEGFVAITHEEADKLGLPRSKVFPWDANKGMYVSHGHHALHCTVLLHAFTYDAHIGKKPKVSYHHIEHCLDLLRQDIMCRADDLMDFTKDHGDEFLTGEGQVRKCRDWNKLSKWVQERTACYKTINITRAGEDHGVAHQLDRYTYCPPGSPYEPLIRAFKDLGRVNPGNLDENSIEKLSPEELKADAEAVAEHNNAILNAENNKTNE
ncbi:hypothetical protein TSTA_038090 [Talaromyces stipitatus ATCC 10500]|uniref:Oxidase ustYa n=1 Tax=Talaromyces stipitatus (strain ATCC 10500 / CBS 375.48 / QM 6759 / NRRL 1006) TaxID=441959 RepID=B8M8T5_TALSN|nr:uncharacterized protein TSTA_038090 [Talaromyces stipitatus ATCC 10500]EED20598.1 hypothetical protein TSTA_038090 [Talaromyces stipitatus ATCC 10500]